MVPGTIVARERNGDTSEYLPGCGVSPGSRVTRSRLPADLQRRWTIWAMPIRSRRVQRAGTARSAYSERTEESAEGWRRRASPTDQRRRWSSLSPSDTSPPPKAGMAGMDHAGLVPGSAATASWEACTEPADLAARLQHSRQKGCFGEAPTTLKSGPPVRGRSWSCRSCWARKHPQLRR